MDSPSTPMSSESFLASIDISRGFSLGERITSVLQSAGLKDEVISDPDVIDEMIGDYQEEWCTILESIEVVTQPEIEAHEELNNKVTEAEVEKVLTETLGSPEKKVCVTEEMVDIASVRWEDTKIKFEAVQKAASYAKTKITECDKNLKSIEIENQNLSCNIKTNYTSIDTALDELSEQCCVLSQVVDQCLCGQTEVDYDTMKSNTPFHLLLHKLMRELLDVVESTSQQLVEDFKVRDELALIFPSPGLEKIKIEESTNEVMDLLQFCQDQFNIIVFLQNIVMKLQKKKELCQNMASHLLKIVPSSVLNITHQLNNLGEYNRQSEISEIITPAKLFAMNEALTGQSSLVTPENFISSLTNLDKKVDEEVTKCAQEILRLNENHLIEITGALKLMEEMDLQADEIEIKAKKFIEYEKAILNLQEQIKNLEDTFSKEDLSRKGKLISLMVLCFIDHDRFNETLKEIKRRFEIMSKAMS